jgi:predicted ATPase
VADAEVRIGYDEPTSMNAARGFIQHLEVLEERVGSFEEYPFSIPAVRALNKRLLLHPQATIFVGENGSGKSTLIEAIAVAAGFNQEGGSTHFTFSTRASVSDLSRCVRLARTERRPRTGYFLRAESFFNVATNIEDLDREPARAPPIISSYGGRSLHEQSHGESFWALSQKRFGPSGLYILDEPEAALSPRRQRLLLRRIVELAHQGSQFLIATHSPIIAAIPGALIYSLSEHGIEATRYEQTDCFLVTRDFLENGRFDDPP